MSFSNFSDWAKALNEKIKESMETDVSNDMVKVMQDHVATDVYKPYTPTDYERTYQLFYDVEGKMVDDQTLEIKDNRYDGDKYIVPIIETGKGYTWGYTRNLDEEIGARPFVENTRNQIDNEQLHVKSLKNALSQRGLDVV